MKPIRKTLLCLLLLTGLPFGWSGCYTDAYVGTGVYYGPDPYPWFRDDLWVDGHFWYREPRYYGNGGIYIHPPHYRR